MDFKYCFYISIQGNVERLGQQAAQGGGYGGGYSSGGYGGGFSGSYGGGSSATGSIGGGEVHQTASVYPENPVRNFLLVELTKQNIEFVFLFSKKLKVIFRKFEHKTFTAICLIFIYRMFPMLMRDLRRHRRRGVVDFTEYSHQVKAAQNWLMVNLFHIKKLRLRLTTMER